MKGPDPSNARGSAARRHLSANASECHRRNITVRVDSVNPDRTVAFCSVEQRERGLLRRTYTHSELVWRAEQALAPLKGLGLLPMINVNLHPAPSTVIRARHWYSLFDWIGQLRTWLGYPQAREGFDGHPVPGDPFGLHRAMLPVTLT